MSKINARHLSHLFPGIFILRYFYFTFSKIFILSFLQICEISKLKCHFHEIVLSFSWDSAWSEKPLFPPGLVKEVSWDLISKEVTYNPFPYRGSPWPCSGTDYNTTLCARSCSGESLTLGAGPGRARLQRWGELSWAEMRWDEMIKWVRWERQTDTLGWETSIIAIPASSFLFQGHHRTGNFETVSAWRDSKGCLSFQKRHRFLRGIRQKEEGAVYNSTDWARKNSWAINKEISTCKMRCTLSHLPFIELSRIRSWELKPLFAFDGIECWKNSFFLVAEYDFLQV